MKHRLSLEKKLAAIKMVKEGQSVRSVSDKLHLGHHLLYEWISVYKEKGVDGLKTDNKRKSKHLSYEEKCKIIREYQRGDGGQVPVPSFIFSKLHKNAPISTEKGASCINKQRFAIAALSGRNLRSEK